MHFIVHKAPFPNLSLMQKSSNSTFQPLATKLQVYSDDLLIKVPNNTNALPGLSLIQNNNLTRSSLINLFTQYIEVENEKKIIKFG